MPDRQVCIDCGTLSPETETNYTLISSQFGWRLTRTRTPDGNFNIEWRCPACWKEHKRVKQGGDEPRAESLGPPPITTGRPLPSFASRPPSAFEDEPTVQRPAVPGAPRMPSEPRGPASSIPQRLPPGRLPRR